MHLPRSLVFFDCELLTVYIAICFRQIIENLRLALRAAFLVSNLPSGGGVGVFSGSGREASSKTIPFPYVDLILYPRLDQKPRLNETRYI